MSRDGKVYVVGHKNPDTDSICSAISYAYLKNQTSGSEKYIPCRAGEISSETAYVLDQFGFKAPELLEDVRTQVSDISLNEGIRVPADTSVKRAWETLFANRASTLVTVNEDGRLYGLITIGDIAKSIMDVHDSNILATAQTPYSNIVDTLEAEVLAGEIEGRKASGKVIIAAANPDLMEEYIEPGDMVITGDRYESQLCAIEMQASCLIICVNGEVNDNILEMAREQGCIILRTQYDTFLAARLMNQSIPIDYFMIRDNVLCFHQYDYTDEIRSVMGKVRHRAFPVLDNEDRYVGILTRQSLLSMERKQMILVDHNEESQAVDGIIEADILEIVDHHKLGKVVTSRPALFRNQPVGCTGTILYMMFQEQQVEIPKEIAGLMCSAIISDTLLYRSPTCTPVDKIACEALAKIAGVDSEAHAKAMFTAASNFGEKTDKEILYQDFKRFATGSTGYGVGQITSMDGDDLRNLADRMTGFMESELVSTGLDMIFFMMTDILEESTILLCVGDGALEKVQEASGTGKEGAAGLMMPGVVSRKKQIIPLLIKALS